MRLLRVLAIFSNIAFVTYGMLVWLPPVFCLHLLLLPVNALRLREMLTPQSPRLPGARPRPLDGRWRSSLRSMSARPNRGTGTAWRSVQPDALHVGFAAVLALNDSRTPRRRKTMTVHPISFGMALTPNHSERDGAVRPFALWPLLLVVGIVALVMSGSDTTLPPDQHMSLPYLQSRMAP
jgi:hypothetical protein